MKAETSFDNNRDGLLQITLRAENDAEAALLSLLLQQGTVPQLRVEREWRRAWIDIPVVKAVKKK